MNVEMAPLLLCVLLSYYVAQSAGGSANYDTMSERDNGTEGMRKDKALYRIRRMGVPAVNPSEAEENDKIYHQWVQGLINASTKTFEELNQEIKNVPVNCQTCQQSKNQHKSPSSKEENEKLYHQWVQGVMNASTKYFDETDQKIKNFPVNCQTCQQNKKQHKPPSNKDSLIKPLIKKRVEIGNFDVTLELIDPR